MNNSTSAVNYLENMSVDSFNAFFKGLKKIAAISSGATLLRKEKGSTTLKGDVYDDVSFIQTIIVFFLFTWILFVIHAVLERSRKRTVRDKRVLFFSQLQLKVKQKFPNQLPETFATITNGVNNILHSYPERPTVLVFLCTSKALRTAEDFARSLASALLTVHVKEPSEDILDSLTLNGDDYNALSANDLKLLSDLNKIFQKNGAAIIYKFQNVTPEEASTLSQIMGKNSIFAEELIILLVDADEEILGESSKPESPAELAGKILSKHWCSSENDEEFENLISVITRQSIVVIPEGSIENTDLQSSEISEKKFCATSSGDYKKTD